MALLDWFTGIDSEEEQARIAETARKDAELQEARLQAGKITPAVYQRNMERIEADKGVNVAQEVNEAFAEGFQEGVGNVRGTIGDILAFPFRLIPPIGWVIIIGVLFFYFGGGVLVRRKLTKA